MTPPPRGTLNVWRRLFFYHGIVKKLSRHFLNFFRTAISGMYSTKIAIKRGKEDSANGTRNGIEALTFERVPPPPSWMKPVAAEYWKKKGADLKALGRLNSSLLETLATYCNLLADMQRTREAMDNAWGSELFFKYQKAFNDASKLQLSFARELGFTPQSAKTLPEPKKKEEPSEFDLL